MRAVVDASVWVDALVDAPRRDAALRILADVEAWAPSLVDVEVMSALARLERARSLTGPEADDALAEWLDAPLDRVESEMLLADAWPLRHALRTTDALYVALARVLDCSLVTSDARLARAPLDGLTVVLVR